MSPDKIRYYFLLTLLILSGSVAAWILKPYMITLLMSVIFAVALFPLYTYFLKKLNNRTSLASLTTLLLVTIAIVSILTFIGSRVFGEAQQVYVSLIGNGDTPNLTYMSESVGTISENFIPGSKAYISQVGSEINTYAKQALEWSFGKVGSVFSRVTALIVQFFIFLIALYYTFKHGTAMRARIINWSPLIDSKDDELLKKISVAVVSVVRGAIGTAVIQGIVACFGFLIFGVPNPFLWGIVTIFTALIPNIGTSLVLVPALLYLLFTGDTTAALGLGIWAVLAVGSIDNIVRPYLSGKGTNLNPLITLLSVFGGLSLFGISGVLLGPIAISIFFAIFTVFTESLQKN